MSEVFYRKFRPNNFSKMVGQSFAVDILTQSVKKERFHHAYLFAGSSGCGKTTAARILAMAVNCTVRKPNQANPCGECDVCVAIRESMAIDVRELNGAVDGTKEEIKKVIESSLYSPVQYKYKVFIIDEAQELSSAAIATLLKPTEEPNSNVIFILCTSEYQKIPITLSSRFTRVFFTPIKEDVITDYLVKLSQHIKATVEQDACREIAAISGNNMRVALNYLETLLLQTDNRLTADQARKLIGLVGRNDLYSISKHIAERNCGAALDVLDAIVSTTPDISVLCRELSVIFRNAQLTANGATKGFSVSSLEREVIDGLAKDIGWQRLKYFTKKFTEAQYAMSIHHNKRWVLETLVANLCRDEVPN